MTIESEEADGVECLSDDGQERRRSARHCSRDSAGNSMGSSSFSAAICDWLFGADEPFAADLDPLDCFK